MKAVIPAAGLGIRFLPATKAQPKEMLPIVDKPCIQYVVEEAVASGISDIIIITGRGKRAIEDHFDRSIELEEKLLLRGEKKQAENLKAISELADIFYIRQKEPLGLGDAILCARKHIGNEPFAVLLADDLIVDKKPALSQLIDTFRTMGGKAIVGLERVPFENIHKYGVIAGIEIDRGLFNITNLVEKPAKGEEPSNLAIIGRYIFTPEIFKCLEMTEKGIGGEIQLTDAMKLLLKKHEIYGKLVDGTRYDIGNKIDWIRANIEFALERPDLRQDIISLLNDIKAKAF